MTENLPLRLLLIFVLGLQIVLNHLTVIQVKRVRHKRVQVALQLTGLLLLRELLLIVQRDDASRTLVLQLLRRAVVLLRVAVVPALTLVSAQGFVFHSPQALVFLQAFHLFLHTFNLVSGHTPLHQFHGNLLLRRSCLLFFHHKLDDLFVSHARLGRHSHAAQ